MQELNLTDDEEKELLRLHRFYEQEVKRCKAGKAYLAGCVMAGASLESALLLMVNIYQDEAAATKKCSTQKKKVMPLLKWKLFELLRVAKTAGWLPYGLEYGVDDWDHKRAKAGDYAEVARELRNLAHPSVYLESLFRTRMTRKYLQFATDCVGAAVDALFERVEMGLAEAMEAEERVKAAVSCSQE